MQGDEGCQENTPRSKWIHFTGCVFCDRLLCRFLLACPGYDGAQVVGNDATIAMAGQSGNFQLNVMLPVVAYNLLQSIELLANASTCLADSAIAGFTVNVDNINKALDRNPILVTALNPVIGYEQGAAIAKKAYAEGRAVKDVAREMTDLSDEELDRLLDPAALTEGGIKH